MLELLLLTFRNAALLLLGFAFAFFTLLLPALLLFPVQVQVEAAVLFGAAHQDIAERFNLESVCDRGFQVDEVDDLIRGYVGPQLAPISYELLRPCLIHRRVGLQRSKYRFLFLVRR